MARLGLKPGPRLKPGVYQSRPNKAKPRPDRADPVRDESNSSSLTETWG